MFSAFFIRRPIFASVISILITLAGLAAMRVLPIEQYPQIVPPQVTVTAVYPGASAEVVAATVATPIEEAINGVEDMLYMSSSSTNNGTYSLTVTFAPGTDPAIAQVNVQNRVSMATPRLPAAVTKSAVAPSFSVRLAASTTSAPSSTATHSSAFSARYEVSRRRSR